MMMAITVLLLLLLAGSSVFVAAVLGVLGGTLAQVFSTFPLIRGLGEMAWSSSADFVLVAVPMFILMGELLLRSGVTDSMYTALDRWVGHIPGGLMHTNIAASAVFAATSGSSIATAATNHNTRHPLVTMTMASTLHRATGGRFCLGLGRGFAPLFDLMGLPRITNAQLTDAFDVLRRLWRGEQFGHEGPIGSYPFLFPLSPLDEARLIHLHEQAVLQFSHAPTQSGYRVRTAARCRAARRWRCRRGIPRHRRPAPS